MKFNFFKIVPKIFAASSVILFAPLFAASSVQAAAGPDVTVFTISDVGNTYGSSGGIRGYSVGTTSCNIGTVPLNWCDNNGGCGIGANGQATTDHDHPVIAQNMYRLKNGRFDQIGASWLKHGFVSTNTTNSACGTLAGQSCTSPPLGGNQLGIGCTDPYNSGLNGSRPLGAKSEVNPTSGAYPFPRILSGTTTNPWNQRLAVAENDLVAASNAGARYFVEGHYVAPDDAKSGNALNNASYREVSVTPTTFALPFIGATVQQKSAIEVWPVIDAAVELVNVDTSGETIERFHVARKVTETSPGVWHYEYAVHNMNSMRAADRLSIEFVGDTTFLNTGYYDVDAHSGEPYDISDWPATSTTTTLQWQAPNFVAAPVNANAIRWGTLYNFWFDANRPPADIVDHKLRLFDAGNSAGELSFWTSVIQPLDFTDGFEDLLP